MQSLTKNSTDTGIKTLMSLKFINFLKENKTFILWSLLGLPQSSITVSHPGTNHEECCFTF